MLPESLSEITNKSEKITVDPYISNLLKFVFIGSRGGITRIRLVLELRKRPLNANCLANILRLDYKGILYQLSVLEKNNLVRRISKMYGSTYSISTFLEVNYKVFDTIVHDYIKKCANKEFKQYRSTIITILKIEFESTKSYDFGVRTKIKCASCECTLEKCREYISCGKCINCSLKKCCCLPFVIDFVCK